MNNIKEEGKDIIYQDITNYGDDPLRIFTLDIHTGGTIKAICEFLSQIIPTLDKMDKGIGNYDISKGDTNNAVIETLYPYYDEVILKLNKP